MQPRHPKLVSRGSEVADADLKFKGAPSDDCDPFAIQNYIDRIAAELYDTLHGPQATAEPGKDEWELMKEKAKGVPFQEVTLSIALKHGLLEEVKKENANKTFEKDNILAIMKVRDEFLRDYPNAKSFEYQWQIWVEWERYLKQIGVTIPQWGKIARKLIRLGVQMIQEDMAKKYSQVNKRKSEDLGAPQNVERRRRLTLPLDPSSHPVPHLAGLSGYMGSALLDPSPYAFAGFVGGLATQYGGTPVGTPSGTPSHSPRDMVMSPANSPRGGTSMGGGYVQQQFSPRNTVPPASMFGASLYTLMAQHNAPGIFTQQSSTPMNMGPSTPNMTSPNMMSPGPSPAPSPAPSPMPSPIICYDAAPYPDVSMMSPALPSSYTPSHTGNTLLPFFTETGFVTSSSSLPTLQQTPQYPQPMMSPRQHMQLSSIPSHSTQNHQLPSYPGMLQYSPPPSPTPPSSLSSSPSMYSPLSISPMSTSPQYSSNFIDATYQPN